MHNIAVLPGDGIGPEIVREAVKVLAAVGARYGLAFNFREALVGGAAIDAAGVPLPDETLRAVPGVPGYPVRLHRRAGLGKSARRPDA